MRCVLAGAGTKSAGPALKALQVKEEDRGRKDKRKEGWGRIGRMMREVDEEE